MDVQVSYLTISMPNKSEFMKNIRVFVRSLLSKHKYVSFTDNVSVPQTLDHSVNPGFAKLVSSTDNSFISVTTMTIMTVLMQCERAMVLLVHEGSQSTFSR